MAEHNETLTFVGTIFAGVSGLVAGIGAALHSRGVQRELGAVKAKIEGANDRIDDLDKAATERRLEGRRFEDRIIAELKEERRLREVRDEKNDKHFGALFSKFEEMRVSMAGNKGECPHCRGEH